MSEMNVGMSEALSGHLRKEDESDALLFKKAECAEECMQNEASFELVASHGRSRGIGFDLNVPHVNSHDNSNSMETSECGSTNGSLEEKHPMSVSKEMKQNSLTSFEYNRLPPPVPKRSGRKTKSEILQKKLEIAKKERVDRFARIATPSGLFNELNPGIINHVRNSKQVYSIIEALVKSECIENGTKMKKPPSKNHGNSVSLDMPLPVSFGVKQECIDFCSIRTDSKMQYKASNFTHGGNTDKLSLKLSSSLLENDSEGVTSLSSDNNATDVSVLTVKAATVASKWLELLYQDGKDRLAALGRSRKRARSVIQTDLPFLIAKEFSSTMSDGSMSTVASKFLKNDEAELHRIRWSSLFSHMEMALFEEEKQLERWISQVKEMKLHCERGLRNETWNSSFCTQPKLRTPGDSFRAASTSNEKDCAVTAAAASIYSTCSFLWSKDKGSR